MTSLSPPDACSQAVVICTRNRSNDLERTLESITACLNQPGASPNLMVLLVDASDAATCDRNRHLAQRFTVAPIRHYTYSGRPSLPAQRNYGIERLPKSVEIVHFLDDDVTVLPGYFRALSRTLDDHPEVGGAGGHVLEPGKAPPARPSLFRRLFLLDGPPGSVLPSGHVAPAQTHLHRRSFTTQWLNGCSSYRRTALDDFRFDEMLDGYASQEDLDFSYRLGHRACLVVEPRARLIHHQSPVNRDTVPRLAEMSLVHRYWFVEKNIRHPLRKPAFWWSVLGQLLARSVSRKPDRDASLRGLLGGISVVLRRDHALLRRNAAGST